MPPRDTQSAVPPLSRGFAESGSPLGAVPRAPCGRPAAAHGCLSAKGPAVCPGTRAHRAPLREQKWSVTISFLSGKCMLMQPGGGVANGPRGLFVSPGQREGRSWRRGVDSPVTSRYCWRLPRNAERSSNQRLAGRDQRYLTIEEERDRKVCGANSMILVPFGGEGRVQT